MQVLVCLKTMQHSPSFPSFFHPDMLCDPTDLIWRKATPFEAMTGHIVPSSDGLLAEVFPLCTAPRIMSSLATDVTDATLGASGLQLGTRIGAGGTATLA